MKKLNDRTLIILQHIADRSKGGRLWLPGSAAYGLNDYDAATGCYLRIEGAGDAASIRGLLTRGLLAQKPPDNAMFGKYDYLFATAAGCELLQANFEQVAAVRDKIKTERRRREYEQEKRNLLDEDDADRLRKDYPEFYATTA
jgi:hypothetical protein